MPLKESSDELNPTVQVRETVGRKSTPSGPLDYLAIAIATFGVGYFPIAPGTWGSLVSVGIYFLLRYLWLGLGAIPFLIIELVLITVITFAGIWAASQTERLSGRKDPGKVVVDEVAGQLIALLPVTFISLWPVPVLVIVSFILFRFFDIVKPYPARRLEGMHGGLGIMCDDLVAGLYAAIVLYAGAFVMSIM